jgi:hypothetical protein
MIMCDITNHLIITCYSSEFVRHVPIFY